MSKRKHAGRGKLSQDMGPVVILEPLSQPSTSRSFTTQPSKNTRKNFISNSQPSTSRTSVDERLCTSQRRTNISRPQRQTFDESRDEIDTNDEGNQLAGTLVRYLLTLDRGKKPITKTSIVKHCLAGQGRQFRCTISMAKTYLSQIFGYNLVEVEGNKYILVNELKNDSAYIQFSEKDTPRQVLLFIVLTHIFMHQECCSEAILWDYLKQLNILNEDNNYHTYFGDVRKIITQDFVAQKYLDKIITEKGDPPKLEFKWGPRAEHEFSRRVALEFVSQVYNSRPLNSWPAQYKTMIAKEKLNNA